MPKDKKTLAFVIRRTYRIVVDSSHRDVAQPGSAFAWGASGRWFESSHPDHKTKRPALAAGFFCFKGRGSGGYKAATRWFDYQQ